MQVLTEKLVASEIVAYVEAHHPQWVSRDELLDKFCQHLAEPDRKNFLYRLMSDLCGRSKPKSNGRAAPAPRLKERRSLGRFYGSLSIKE